MARIAYIGNQAGLRPEAQSAGDMNSLFDYVVFCDCGSEKDTPLGPLGRFQPNKDGYRTPWCPVCQHALVIDKNGQILRRLKVRTEDIYKAIKVG